MQSNIDYFIIAGYLILITIWGSFTGGKQKSIDDYFLGSKSVPWWAVCFSIVAAETSTLTFISIPGLAYLTNLNFIQVTIGYLIGRIVIAIFFLPEYFSGNMETAYSYLQNRFGIKTRQYASIVFLFTRTAADGVRLFATAIPLKLMLNIDYPTAIVIIAIITLLYTLIGGVKGIIWVDVVQLFIYIGGALISAFILINYLLPHGIDSVLTAASSSDKLQIFNLGFSGGIAEFFNKPYTLLAGLLGGAFLSMASHGTDQLIVQRLLTTNSLKSARKAIIGSGIIVILQFLLFMFVGVALFAYYGSLNIKSDEIFPKFIIEQLPVGISGFIIAGLFAAAMSTLAGSISALSSSTMLDLIRPKFKNLSTEKELFVSRGITVFWCVLLIFAALVFMNSPHTVVELALSIASFTYGGLLGTFMLGRFVKSSTQEDALAAFTGGILIMVTIISLQIVAWTWFTLIGVMATLVIGYLLSKLNPQ